MSALQSDLKQASIYIGIAAVLDFFDGFVARALKAHSEIGKQLDSLADVISFGVAPGMIWIMLMQSFDHAEIAYVGLLIPVFSAIRLAKFNIDTRQSDSFIGLPTPANALFIAALPFLTDSYPEGVNQVLSVSATAILFPVLSAYVMVAELPLIALKFKSFSWKHNEFRWLLISLSVISIAVFKIAGVSIAIVFYILLSIIQNYTKPSHDKV